MVFSHSHISCHRPCYFSILFLLILSTTQVRYKAEARPYPKSDSFSQTEEKALLRARIGSRPPKCERRCSACGHCEAIQVPTNPQVRYGKKKKSSTLFADVAYARGEYNSNYKPISWKCKCGNSIFNP